VFHLRRALEPGRARGAADGVLVTRHRGYLLLADREHLDAARFEDGFTAGRAALEAGRPEEAAATLHRSLELWRGPVLADLAGYGFTRPEAARLEELRLAALQARIDADLALGRHDALTAELDQLAAEHPLRERLHGQLMVALYRCGRQADALAAYRRARDLLAEELGIDPGEPLQRLHAAVLAHDPALDWPASPPAPAGDHHANATATAPVPKQPSPPSISGRREREWTRRHARRLLAAGSALAVAAAVGIIVAVTQPWAGQPAGLPADSVGLIDPSGGRAGAPVSVGSPAGLAYGDGSVWAVDTTEGTLSRINPATHAVVDQIPVGTDPTAVTVTGSNVWVANSGSGTVSQISAAAGKVVQTIPVGNVPVAIASGPSGVWVANQGDDTVDWINPFTGVVTRRNIQVGGGPDGIAVGRSAVWVVNGQDGTVTRIDPATGQPSDTVHVGAGPADIAVTPAAVWVANSLDLTVSKIDPATDTETAIVSVGDGPGAIAAATDGIWVSDQFGATLDRIDPQTGRVDRVISIGSSPQGMAAAGSGVWVAARPFAAATHRGGTLTVVTQWLPQRDPALEGGATDVPALAAVYDGLVAMRKSGGTRGFTLVPDLAARLPMPTGGGKTYTFTLRPGIRYSSGAPVRASDFRRGIQRQLSFGFNPTYYDRILGAQQCMSHPRRCRLSAGIVANDAAGTVTFHLAQADPDFLYKLALPLAVPAPPGAPSHAIDRAPFLPGTGPYMISQYRPNTSFTLVRNPYFRQWSYAAQPVGYPDIIRFDHVANPSKQLSAVTAGRTDLVDLGVNGQSSRRLAVRYPTRLYSSLKVGANHVFLNTRRPPFNNVTVRQAINYAIDRSHMIHLLGLGPGGAAVTCQILPVDFPGHQPYCPYTTGRKDGTWHGPDMRKAIRLVKASHTTNVPVTVWSYVKDAGQGAYLVRLLKRLGYQATLHSVSADKYYLAIGEPQRKIQLGLASWGADFPSPPPSSSPY
jgi:YVTN family beta-propeller protein